MSHPRQKTSPEGVRAIAWMPEELPAFAEAAPWDAGAPTPAQEAASAAELQAPTEAQLAEAYTAGYEDGRTDAAAAEQAKLRDAMRAVERALEEVSAAQSEWLDALEENVSALAVAVARHLVGREIAGDPALGLDLIRRAVAELPPAQPVVVRVNPADHVLLLAAGERTALTGRDAQWVADSRVAAGGCLVEGRDFIVDGRIDTALERLYRRLIGVGGG